MTDDRFQGESVPFARPCKNKGDTGPYTFMPMPGLATSRTQYESVWTCVTIYLARPLTGQNVHIRHKEMIMLK